MKKIALVLSILGLSACGSSGGGGAAISLTTGFSPDPSTVTGQAGGSAEGSSLSSDCNGYVSTNPSHVMTLGAAFPHLRVMVHAAGGADTTLLIRRPDGTFICNDDSEGLDPMVEGEFPAGEYGIFVGSYSGEDHPDYTLGVSAGTTATPSTLGQ